MFADLFAEDGRRSVPPMIVAVVMVLQRLEGLSNREAVERFAFDVRWKYAAGGLDLDHPGFVHTVLVDMRARPAASERPNRIFERTVQVAAQAGLAGRRRVLDSTPIYDAVATQDTVTLIRSAVRGLLRAADHVLRAELRAMISSADAYTDMAKPVIDWTDAAEREALVDSRAGDGYALPAVLDGRTLEQEVAQAARLPATVLGQDLEAGGEGGVLRIARKVAKDRVISTVDPEARHGHKSVSRSFDGYKGHIADDPDSEIITATVVSAGNVGDAGPAAELPADILSAPAETAPAEIRRAEVYGDAAYGTGPLPAEGDIISMVKVQPANAPGGRFSKDVFTIDLDAGQVTCPNRVSVEIRPQSDGGAVARFGAACVACPLAARCTTARDGRVITISPHEGHLARGRADSRDPDWLADYRATRPKVERKLAHMLRRRHGGRRARMRGRAKIDADFSLPAAAVNLARLGVLGVASTIHGSWTVATV
ncbi:IS1182 family transposase [Streptosporangium sp. CA-115845]|uniref:IS1182 family transposase n=1 Tax=Streptosporangium sp. CA-115845 TaxID=3240071 RepID=UPI003D8FCB39